MKKIYYVFWVVTLLMSSSLMAHATITNLSFDEEGYYEVPLTEVTAEGGFTFDVSTGVLTCDGTVGRLVLNIPTSGIDLSEVTDVILTRSGDDLVKWLRVKDLNGKVISSWNGSRYHVNGVFNEKDMSSVGEFYWESYGYTNKDETVKSGTMTISSIKLKKYVAPDLTLFDINMYQKWDGSGADATSQGVQSTSYNLNTTVDPYSSIVGNGSYDELQYADLTDYEYIVVHSSTPGNKIRFVFNNHKDDPNFKYDKTFTVPGNGELALKLTDIKDQYGYVHLNGIKSMSKGTIVTKINIYKAGGYTPTGIGSVKDNASVKTNGKFYNQSGQRVDTSYKGIVIRDGKKFLMK